MRDFLSQLDVFDDKLGVESDGPSSCWLRFDCLRPRSFDDDFGLVSGSTASLKYSWLRACAEVGLCFGSHSRHQVTKSLRLCGHCGALKIVSNECGAICASLAAYRKKFVRRVLTFGKEKPNFCASFTPSFHSPPPTFWPCLFTHAPGLPMISQILQT